MCQDIERIIEREVEYRLDRVFGSEGMAKFKSGIELNGDGEGVGVKLRADVDAMLKAPVGELDPPLDFEVGLFCIVELRRCFCICNERREVAGRENVSSTHLENCGRTITLQM